MSGPCDTMMLISRLKALRKDSAGATIIEFTFALPMLLTLGFGGVELANYVRLHQLISQVGVNVTDNGSRAKELVVGGSPRFRESDIAEIFAAAERQGKEINLQRLGKIIVSSVEQNGDGGQMIKWQRCFGDADYSSAYGEEGDGASGTTMLSVGKSGHDIAAEPGTAIIVTEIFYEYESITGGVEYVTFLPVADITYFSAAYVRDDRDLSGIFASPGVTPATCD